VSTVAALVILAGTSWALGSLAPRPPSWSGLRRFELIALRTTAGLGLTALLLSLAALTGVFAYTTPALALLAGIGVVLAATSLRRQSGDPTTRRDASAWGRVVWVAILTSACLATIGAIAPVTDDDALAYVVPIARHIADAGAIHVWTDQARSMWPQSQQILLAFVLQAGGDRLGLVTALEWWLCIGVVAALAGRVCERREHVGAALVLALGAPVLAFQVASAKEDLLLLTATAATAFCLAGAGDLAELAAAGLFAGIAAGAKYPGALVAAAAVSWTFIRHRERRFTSTAVIALCAAASGGIWYALNLWRYGNPVAPFLFGARGTTMDARVAQELLDAYGAGRGALAFVLAPARIFVRSDQFCGRANLYNPLVYAGLAGLLIAPARRRHGPLFFMASVLYVGWFLTLQNARLLVPAAVLLAPAAADRLVPIAVRSRTSRAITAAAVLASLGIVASVGVVRAVRYFRDPPRFLERETQNYADVEWMNTHLDLRRDRVASDRKVLAYLEVPFVFLDSSYQLEISAAELDDSSRLLEALRRQQITHLFGSADSFPDLRPHLRAIYQNPSSRLGGVRFFREPPSEPTAVFEIHYPAPEGPATLTDGR
jgi:hypothetical protein